MMRTGLGKCGKKRGDIYMKKRIKKIISMIVCASIILAVLPVECAQYIGICVRAFAATESGDTFSVNGLNYRILNDNASVTVTGAMDKTISELEIPKSVRYDDYEFQVTEIAT